MARSFTEEYKPVSDDRTVFRFHPSTIQANQELRGRHVKPNIAALKASIKKNGQLEPVLCRQGPQKEPILVFGYSRWEAISELAFEEPDAGWTILVKFPSANINEADAFNLAQIENMDRNDLTPLDMAYNVGRMMNVYGKSADEVADTLNKSKAWVGQMQKVFALPHEMQDKISKGEISVDVALSLVKNPKGLELIEDAKAAKKAEKKDEKPADDKKEKSPGKKHADVTKSDIDKAKAKAGENHKPTLAQLKKLLQAYAEDKRYAIRLHFLMDFLGGKFSAEQFTNRITQLATTTPPKK